VAQCQEWLPQVVVLDLRMPVMDGYEAARRIRAAHGSAVKIVVLSASVFAEDQRRALAAGADIFLAKPFGKTDLLERIRQLTGVQYEYENPDPANAAAQTEAGAEIPAAVELRRLPGELVDALYEATRRADYDEMLALTDQVGTRDALLGRRLRQLVVDYDYNTLQNILSNSI
jgi:DNA-binding response OmpR family regulator